MLACAPFCPPRAAERATLRSWKNWWGSRSAAALSNWKLREEDVVVDRRVLVEEEERSTKERRYGEIKEGETVHGEVRSLTGYGAFVDIGGVDALLHVGDISLGPG